MKDKKRIEVFQSYKKNLRPKSREQEVEVSSEEVVSPEQVYFHFAFLCCFLYYNEINLSKQKG